jgi:organic radical activating enzyme
MTDYFCVLPFFGAEYTADQKTVPCCLMDLSKQSVDSIRQDMLEKRKPVACKKCWDLEDAGHESDRQLKNRTFDYYSDTDIRVIEENCVEQNYSKKIIKLYTSNLCNSTCFTCEPASSSSWNALRKKQIPLKIINKSQLDFDYTDINMLSFVGGEPLYEKRNFDVLTELINHGNDSCFVSFVTNGSVEFTNQQIEILSKFKNLNICLSIDGIESRFEYMRFPLKWSKLISNIQIFRQLTPNISASYTISNLNLFYYSETINWFQEQKIPHNHNLVNRPNHLNPGNLNDAAKSRALENNKEYTTIVQEFINSGVYSESLYEKFLLEIQQQDQLKKISIKDYMPELKYFVK